jgi:hypothetical protein
MLFIVLNQDHFLLYVNCHIPSFFFLIFHFPLLDAKANGNVFGVALSQCVNNDDSRLQDDHTNVNASGTNRKDSSNDMIGVSTHERRSSPSGSISSTNDSGCSISPASPSSLYVGERERNFEEKIMEFFVGNRFLILIMDKQNFVLYHWKHWDRMKQQVESIELKP